ncbi:MAG: NUDIX hydrolase [Deltaproteobacteria bacterium]
MTPDRPSTFRVGAYGLLVEDGRLLITRTITRSGILNNFPGGAIELGEAPLAAVVREFREETGLVVRTGELVHATEGYHRSAAYPENQLIKIYWRVEVMGGELRLEGNGDDVAGCLWADLHKLEALELGDSDREAVERLGFLGQRR